MNNGNHWTKGKDDVNWNRELIWKMRMELEDPWDSLEDAIPTTFQNLLDSVQENFRDLKSLPKDQGFTSMMINSIESRIDDIEYKFGLVRRDFAREIRLNRIMASEPNETSYIVGEMIPAYRAASQLYGADKAARQRNLVQGRIENGTLFPNIFISISSGIKKVVRQKFTELSETVEANFESMMNDIDMAVDFDESYDDSDGDETVDGDEEKEILMVHLTQEIQALKVRHKQVLESIL